MRERLVAANGLLDTEGGRLKVAAYDCAVSRGTVLPPVSVIYLDGELYLEDGAHRCTVAASRGERSVPAVVYKVASLEEADAVGVLLAKLEAAGVSWQVQPRMVAAMLGNWVQAATD
jgi:hypothetical protein